MTIIDRRGNGKKSLENKKRFIERYREYLKDKVDSISRRKKLTDALKDRTIIIPEDPLGEPTFRHDGHGDQDFVLPGNKKLGKGDFIPKPQGGKGSGAGNGSGGGGNGEFPFTLTKEEFIDIYFYNMCLPNFIKENLLKSIKFVRQKAGFSKYGIPARLSIRKTFEKAFARRLATKAQIQNELSSLDSEKDADKIEYLENKKPRFIDDVDIRYDYYTKRPKPVRHAVMFCIMDVSGSMGEHERALSKKFFLLLYLFLHKSYKFVDLVFIQHTTEAKEVDEDTFFYGESEMGGTKVSSAVQLMKEIIDERFDLSSTNIYVAQASDGDNWDEDNNELHDLIHEVIKSIQYYAYLEVTNDFRPSWGSKTLYEVLRPLENRYKNFKARRAYRDSDVFPVLQDLFQEGENK